MNEFIVMFRNVLIFVALAIPGYLLVKSDLLKLSQSGILSKILMYLGMPFLVFSGVVNNLSFSADMMLTLGVAAGIGIVYTFVMFFVSKPLTGIEKNGKTRGMMQFCAVFANNGFLGIPLAIAVFGRDSQVFTVLILLNLINNILMYTLGAYLVTGDIKSISLKKAFLNPVMIAFIAGMIVNLLQLPHYIPEVITFSDYFSGIVTPISMTILGMKLAAVRFACLLRSWRLYYVAALKLIAFPVAIVVILLLLGSASMQIEYKNLVLGVFVAFAMPTAGLSATFADEFGGDADNAVIFTLGTTILSILTIPSLYWILTFFI